MTEKLKPCPFCGNHAVEPRKFPLINRIGIYCDICGNVSFYGDECKDFKAIVRKWNMRKEEEVHDIR